MVEMLAPGIVWGKWYSSTKFIVPWCVTTFITNDSMIRECELSEWFLCCQAQLEVGTWTGTGFVQVSIRVSPSALSQ